MGMYNRITTENETEFGKLHFNEHPNGFGVQAIIKYDNGYGASVVKHDYSYGGRKGLFEIAVLDKDGELHYDNPVAGGDVLGYLTKEDVSKILEQISKL
jgi:hypothetical protein